MIEKTTPSRVIFNILNYAFMAAFAIVCIIPVWHVVMASISDPRLLMGSSGILLKPLGKVTLEGYGMVLQNAQIFTGYANTIFYVVFTAVLGTILTAIAGYLVSRKDFKPAKALTIYIMITMIFSAGTIPTYMVIRNLGMLNTRWAILIPGVINAYYIIIMKSAFEQLPDSFEESAKLDGANSITILFRILLPMVKPTLAVIIMFTVIMQWNSWYPASIYLPKERELWPLQLFMREMLIQNDTNKIVASSNDANAAVDMVGNLVKYCVTVVGTAPILLAYPFAQKYFVTGITLGGVKG